ncbi:hypothetical protein CWB73_05625 [Pseudoalteromonas phenolica]|uniref:Lipoprotein n=1 Tax=Pseudoalteromonas phenolica TaxID=161398 RepID=A0A5S3YW12_9GAMM|nr:hypothetical protein [Pseudoalteromonas phenolica]TMP81882.1 hypothetical protein CWB73_05625 [Pseudoalteromonas phenolica]
MKRLLIAVLPLAFVLSGCKVNEGEAYEKDKAPEERSEYVGTEGLVQAQKDKQYLMGKELRDKCNDAKISYAVAKSNNNEKEAQAQKAIIANTCKGK